MFVLVSSQEVIRKQMKGVLLPSSKMKKKQSERQRDREIESVEEEVCAVQD